jgi:hypothetical protein
MKTIKLDQTIGALKEFIQGIIVRESVRKKMHICMFLCHICQDTYIQIRLQTETNITSSDFPMIWVRGKTV